MPNPSSDGLVERVARAADPSAWRVIDALQSSADFFRSKIGRIGYRDGTSEQNAQNKQRMADEYRKKQMTRYAAAIEAAGVTALSREVAVLREALEAIMEVGGEINPSNYNHEDVCALNNAFVEQFQIAEAALASPRNQTPEE